MSKKLNREIKCIDHLQGHNKRQGFSHYTDRDIRSNVLFAPNQWLKRIQLSVFNGEKRSYQNWKAALMTCVHLIKVISERFQSHFSEYALMISK